MTERFTLGEFQDEHARGNAKCPDCWMSYPKPHAGCTGLMHAEFGDENCDGDYWLYTKCDVCGKNEYDE